MYTMQMNTAAGDLKSPVRNRYFYGKMLDVFHFELEQEYFNQKRWLLNQRVVGCGVICGLDVTLGQDGRSIMVQPGMALDRCGREIIVACPSAPISLDPWMKPPATAAPPVNAPVPGAPAGAVPGQPAVPVPAPPVAPPPPGTVPADGPWVHVCLCYHECETDPVPAFGGDCDTDERCSSGAIRERYKIDICSGKIKVPQPKCTLTDLFPNKTLDYGALARLVTRACVKVSDACCIPIANIQLPPPVVAQPGAGAPAAPGNAQQPAAPVIDITVRPVVLSNPLLFQLMLCLCGSGEQTPCSSSY
jgi:hypothetical protein